MKKIAFIALLALPITLIAQVNDMFYVPKKEIKQKNVERVLSANEETEWDYENNTNTRDVDEYNRRGTATINAENVEMLLQENNVYEYDDEMEESDYNYSTRIVRFHNPKTVIVSSPLYWDVYPSAYYYDYYDYYWDWDWNWNLGWGFNNWQFSLGCHWPTYSHHWYGGHSHHHHHHTAYYPSHRSIQSHIPSVSLRENNTGNRRRPIATTVTGNEKRQTTQVRNKNTERVSTRKSIGNKQERTEKRPSTSRNREKEKSSSTYNRRSSTSVRSNSSSSNSENRRSSIRSSSENRRSSIGNSSRSSSPSRSSSAPSRGGVSRGSRR